MKLIAMLTIHILSRESNLGLCDIYSCLAQAPSTSPSVHSRLASTTRIWLPVSHNISFCRLRHGITPPPSLVSAFLARSSTKAFSIGPSYQVPSTRGWHEFALLRANVPSMFVERLATISRCCLSSTIAQSLLLTFLYSTDQHTPVPKKDLVARTEANGYQRDAHMD